MTTLASILRGPAAPVLHRLAPDVAPAAVERAAVAAGWGFAVVESGDAADKAGALAAFQSGLGLPEWFGHNLDALVDALRDIDPGDDAAGLVVLWDRPDRFAAAAADDYRAILDILARRAGDDRRARVVVLVRPAPPSSSD